MFSLLLVFQFFYFCSWSLTRVLFVFNLVFEFQFDIVIFLFGHYFFEFLFFFLNSFVKVLLVFNFIVQSKFMMCFFQFDSCSFDFFYQSCFFFSI